MTPTCSWARSGGERVMRLFGHHPVTSPLHGCFLATVLKLFWKVQKREEVAGFGGRYERRGPGRVKQNMAALMF